VLLCLLPLGAGLLYYSYAQVAKARAVTLIARGDSEGARTVLSGAAVWAKGDPEVWDLMAAITPSPGRLEWLQNAAQRGPNARRHRAIAREYLAQGDASAAVEALRKALEWDPNNLPALEMSYKAMDEARRFDEARRTAERLVAVEGTDYWKIRAIPELVPTETFAARLYLADKEPDRTIKARLMREAVEGFARYAKETLPSVVSYAKNGLPFAEETLPEAEQKMATAKEAAEALQRLYSTMGSASEAAEVGEPMGLFEIPR
jgi:tetratricopeptide (TPR) repeat protein